MMGRNEVESSNPLARFMEWQRCVLPVRHAMRAGRPLGKRFDSDLASTSKLLNSAAHSGLAVAMLALAIELESGEIYPQNVDAAQCWRQKAEEAGAQLPTKVDETCQLAVVRSFTSPQCKPVGGAARLLTLRCGDSSKDTSTRPLSVAGLRYAGKKQLAPFPGYTSNLHSSSTVCSLESSPHLIVAPSASPIASHNRKVYRSGGTLKGQSVFNRAHDFGEVSDDKGGGVDSKGAFGVDVGPPHPRLSSPFPRRQSSPLQRHLQHRPRVVADPSSMNVDMVVGKAAGRLCFPQAFQHPPRASVHPPAIIQGAARSQRAATPDTPGIQLSARVYTPQSQGGLKNGAAPEQQNPNPPKSPLLGFM